MQNKDFQTVIVPIRVDENDSSAISIACSLFRTGNVPRNIIALYVIEIDRSLPIDVDLTVETMQAEAYLEKLRLDNKAYLEKYDCSFTPDVKQAREIGLAIIDESVEFNADLIVISSGTTNKFGEYSLDEVSYYVLENAKCRVVFDQQISVKEEQ